MEGGIHNERPLPAGWALAAIGEMIAADGTFSDGDWVESKDQDPNGDVRLVQLADIGDGTYRDRSNRYLTSAKAIELGCTFLESGDLLIARMPDPLGRACVFPGDPKQCVTAVDVCIVRTGTESVDHRWLMFAVNSPGSRAAIASYQSGSTRKRISRRNLAKIQFPIPPLAEQQRIVAEIETQFTRLDAAVAALQRAQATLQRYKASVLKAACEGRLLPPETVGGRYANRPTTNPPTNSSPASWPNAVPNGRSSSGKTRSTAPRNRPPRPPAKPPDSPPASAI
jgi:type I restriction enzyme S subunit